jgi:hypothetical protein
VRKKSFVDDPMSLEDMCTVLQEKAGQAGGGVHLSHFALESGMAGYISYGKMLHSVAQQLTV